MSLHDSWGIRALTAAALTAWLFLVPATGSGQERHGNSVPASAQASAPAQASTPTPGPAHASAPDPSSAHGGGHSDASGRTDRREGPVRSGAAVSRDGGSRAGGRA